MYEIYEFVAGRTPVLVSIPHSGTQLPSSIGRRLTPAAQALPDTDWHLDRLYAFVTQLGAAKLVAKHSRYVVDLNRPPDDHRLYETATTGLFPVMTFDGAPIYSQGGEPDEAQRAARMKTFYQPYHEKITAVLAEMKRQFGHAVLFDAHSIASQVPRLFSGDLPDLNIGTNDGRSAAESLTAALQALCERSPFSTVVNGRFKGGYITRHYGQPASGIHAIQLEMPRRLYMREDGSWEYETQRAEKVLPTLHQWVETLLAWQPK